MIKFRHCPLCGKGYLYLSDRHRRYCFYCREQRKFLRIAKSFKYRQFMSDIPDAFMKRIRRYCRKEYS